MCWISQYQLTKLYLELYSLFYMEPRQAKLLDGSVLTLSTMRGGIRLNYRGQEAFLRRDQVNNWIYLDVKVDDGWEHMQLWDREAKSLANALKQLITHCPFVPSDEGVISVSY